MGPFTCLPRQVASEYNYNFFLDLDGPEVLSITDCVQGVAEALRVFPSGIHDRESREHKAARQRRLM